MSSETLAAPLAAAPMKQSPWAQFRQTWFYRFLLFPIGQIFVFIAGAAIILTLLAYLLALLVPEPRPGIVLADQITRQLPGMIITGVGIGFVYAMVALGYTLVYGVLKFINFAHSEIFMFGSVVGFEFAVRLFAGAASDNPSSVVLFLIANPALLILCLVLAAMLAAGLLAVIIERVAYRPLRRAPRLVPLITAIGISFVLQDSVRAFEALTRNDFNLTYPTNQIGSLGTPVPLVFNGVTTGAFNIGGQTYEQVLIDDTPIERFQVGDNTYETITVGGISLGGVAIRANQFTPLDAAGAEIEDFETISIGGSTLDALNAGSNVVNIRATLLVIMVSAVLMLIALNYFVNGTKVGRGIRAISQDQTTAGLMGINVNLLISITFFVGGALGGAAGALFGLNVGTVTPYVGFIPGLKAFTAAVLGGIGNVTGALLGGITLGMIEAFLNGTLVYFPAFGARYTDVFTFAVLILILIFRPSGILGERVDEKV